MLRIERVGVEDDQVDHDRGEERPGGPLPRTHVGAVGGRGRGGRLVAAPDRARRDSDRGGAVCGGCHRCLPLVRVGCGYLVAAAAAALRRLERGLRRLRAAERVLHGGPQLLARSSGTWCRGCRWCGPWPRPTASTHGSRSGFAATCCLLRRLGRGDVGERRCRSPRSSSVLGEAVRDLLATSRSARCPSAPGCVMNSPPVGAAAAPPSTAGIGEDAVVDPGLLDVRRAARCRSRRTRSRR